MLAMHSCFYCFLLWISLYLLYFLIIFCQLIVPAAIESLLASVSQAHWLHTAGAVVAMGCIIQSILSLPNKVMLLS